MHLSGTCSCTEHSAFCRRRRLLELLGLDFSDDSQKDALSSEEQSDIEHLLMTSLEDESQKR